MKNDAFDLAPSPASTRLNAQRVVPVFNEQEALLAV